LFEERAAPAAIFLEDDLVLSPHYINILDHLLAANSFDERVGYLAAYGNHNLSLAQQVRRKAEVCALHHNWGFALYRRQWERMRPYVLKYLSLVRDCDYQRRDHAAIADLFASWGYGAPATSQDAAKTIACCLTKTIKINTVACFARYIGAVGAHMDVHMYKDLNYSKTEVMSELVTEFKSITDGLYFEIFAEQILWADRPRMRNFGIAAESVQQSERLFHEVNRLMGKKQIGESASVAKSAIEKLQTGTQLRRQLRVGFYPLATLWNKHESHVGINLIGANVRITCAVEMLAEHFSNYFFPFVLLVELLNMLPHRDLQGGFMIDLGDGSDIGGYPLVSFSTALGDATLVVDPEFYKTRGYLDFRKLTRTHSGSWVERKDVVYWRGKPVGRRAIAREITEGEVDWSSVQRLHLCAVASKLSYSERLDIGLSSTEGIMQGPIRDAIDASGFIRGPGHETDLLSCRYVLVLDGNTSCGNGLYEALLSGACVILVESPTKARSWFYDKLTVGETHLVVRADLADLDSCLKWTATNPDGCEKIASRGQRVADSMDFETEMRRSAERITNLLRQI
jgi:hypothetical protein